MDIFLHNKNHFHHVIYTKIIILLLTRIKKEIWCLTLAIIVGCAIPCAADSIAVDYSAGITLNTGGSKFAPYYIASNRGGTVTQQHSALISAAIKHDMDTTRRLAWGAGAEVWAGYSSSVDYKRYDAATATWSDNAQHPSRLWIQQLWVEGKYRGVFLTVGQKDINPGLVNRDLSSGDLIMSGNARPPIGANAGFVNFQNIPFTRGWVQIRGEYGFYRLGDGKWIGNHYNRYNSFVNTKYWYNYKNIYFRTNPTKPLVFTFGAQAACQFAGTVNYYHDGKVWRKVKMKADAKAFWRTLFASSGGENFGDRIYVQGNHVGSWDIALDYKFTNGDIVRGYYQSVWEEGSGIGKLNGFDGLWGLEYRSGRHGIVTGAVIEFIDFMNQSGAIHFAHKDLVDDEHPHGSDIGYSATGSDDYYNNYSYNGYQNRGMSIGTPMARSPLYNTDGYLRYTDNRFRGFHLGIMGDMGRQVNYRALFSWRRSFGTPFFPRTEPLSCTSMMLEAIYSPQWLHGLQFKAQLAHDHGKLYGGNNTGALLSITYNGNFTLKK